MQEFLRSTWECPRSSWHLATIPMLNTLKALPDEEDLEEVIWGESNFSFVIIMIPFYGGKQKSHDLWNQIYFICILGSHAGPMPTHLGLHTQFNYFNLLLASCWPTPTLVKIHTLEQYGLDFSVNLIDWMKVEIFT